jgi:hypothetical protein
MGKYSRVLEGLPRYRDGEQKYLDKVEDAKTTIRQSGKSSTGLSLSNQFRELRQRKKDLAKQLSDLNVIIEAHTQILVEQFEVEGVSSMRFSLDADDKRLIRVQSEPYAQVTDRDVHRKWAIDNGLERSLMLPWQTTNALAKERLLAGEPEPDGVTVFVKDKIIMSGKGPDGERFDGEEE